MMTMKAEWDPRDVFEIHLGIYVAQSNLDWSA